jgi:hypothetical protein
MNSNAKTNYFSGNISFLSLLSACGRAKLLRTEICSVQLFPNNGSHFPHGRIFCVTLFDEVLWQIFVTNFCDEF